MARPKKQTVDYFPHFVSHKRTMFVIEGKWGNDGYAFWFKLLEILGSSEGHSFDCNLQENWEFLLAKTHVSTNKANDIMDTLASLEAIDPELWKKKVVWCQNFVDGLNPVYDNRKTKPPSKPNFISTGSLLVKTQFLLEPLPTEKVETPISTSSNPNNYGKKPSSYGLEYSRVEERKGSRVKGVEESKEKEGEETEERKPNAAPPTASPPEVNSPLPKTTPKTKPRNQQLADLAELFRVEDPEEYQKLLKKHPELIADKIPWETK